MVFQRYRPATEYHQRPDQRDQRRNGADVADGGHGKMQTHLAADQRPGAYADIKDAREQRHGDVGGIRSGGQHFHLHAETDNHDRHPRRC